MVSHAAARDGAGRTLYDDCSRRLPGLGQPPPPVWTELEEPVRERWRRHAEAYRPVEGTPSAMQTTPVKMTSSTVARSTARDTAPAQDTPGTPRNGGWLRFRYRAGR